MSYLQFLTALIQHQCRSIYQGISGVRDNTDAMSLASEIALIQPMNSKKNLPTGPFQGTPVKSERYYMNILTPKP
jgi:hypothetical protein